jgi:hypothetical protein
LIPPETARARLLAVSEPGTAPAGASVPDSSRQRSALGADPGDRHHDESAGCSGTHALRMIDRCIAFDGPSRFEPPQSTFATELMGP